MRVDTGYINSTKGTASEKERSLVTYIPSVSGTLGDTGLYRHTTEPVLVFGLITVPFVVGGIKPGKKHNNSVQSVIRSRVYLVRVLLLPAV